MPSPIQPNQARVMRPSRRAKMAGADRRLYFLRFLAGAFDAIENVWNRLSISFFICSISGEATGGVVGIVVSTASSPPQPAMSAASITPARC